MLTGVIDRNNKVYSVSQKNEITNNFSQLDMKCPELVEENKGFKNEGPFERQV